MGGGDGALVHLYSYDSLFSAMTVLCQLFQEMRLFIRITSDNSAFFNNQCLRRSDWVGSRLFIAILRLVSNVSKYVYMHETIKHAAFSDAILLRLKGLIAWSSLEIFNQNKLDNNNNKSFVNNWSMT